MNKTILILDSSQIDAFLTCPSLWDYEYRKRLIKAERTGNTPMDMGTYGHKLLEIYYKEQAKGQDSTKALGAAFAYDLDKNTCHCGHGIEHHRQVQISVIDPLTPQACASIGCTCTMFSAVPFPLDVTDRSAVRDRVLMYTMVEGNGLPALRAKSPDHVEVGFSHKLYEDDNRLYILEGRIDLIGQIANNCLDGWVDHKFQVRERDLYLKSIQFRNYALVTQKDIGVVNYIRFAKKIEKDKTFKRAIISFSRMELEFWRDQLINIFGQVEKYINGEYLSSDSHRWSACSGKYGYSCDFTDLCENYMLPSLVQVNMDTKYKVRPEWRPW
jgi:hypothetical protein